MRHISLRALAVFILLLAHMAVAGTPNRVTILYDSFGKSPTLTMDWGFAALVDYGGKRILFDTGNNAQIFEHNVKAAGVDLQKLDFVVMSHRHGDHMGGLAYLLKVNPTVKIYAPKERSGVYGDDQPSSTWYRKDPSLPAEQRYYSGAPPEIIHMGEAWPSANFQLIDNIKLLNTNIVAMSGELRHWSQGNRRRAVEEWGSPELQSPQSSLADTPEATESLTATERRSILKALIQTNGNTLTAARVLGIGRT